MFPALGIALSDHRLTLNLKEPWRRIFATAPAREPADSEPVRGVPMVAFPFVLRPARSAAGDAVMTVSSGTATPTISSTTKRPPCWRHKPLGGQTIAIAAGDLHICTLLSTGALRCWGYGSDGALGYGNRSTIGDDETPASAGDVPYRCAESPARRTDFRSALCAGAREFRLKCASRARLRRLRRLRRPLPRSAAGRNRVSRPGERRRALHACWHVRCTR